MINGIKLPLGSFMSETSGDVDPSNDLIRVIKTRIFEKNNSDVSYHFQPSLEVGYSDSKDSDSNIVILPSEKYIQDCRLADSIKADSHRDRDVYIPLANNNDEQSLYDTIRESQCVSTLCTFLYLTLMFISLFLPLSLHLSCQFRLYDYSFNIPDEVINELNNYNNNWNIIDSFKEFENFFVTGIFLYLTIQFTGFISTHRRLGKYLRKLCKVSIDFAKEQFLYNNKLDALENFRNYAKNLYSTPTTACINTEQNLIKSYDEASYTFNETKVSDIWSQTKCLQFKLFIVKVWIPFVIHLVTSIGICTFVYDRRLRVRHSVPLAHPEIIANMHWYVALQYEGVWCIAGIFVFNIFTWLYLCHINHHENFFYNLDNAVPITQGILEDYANQVSKKIWDDQMLLFATTAYADADKIKGKNFSVSFSQASYKPENDGKLCICKHISSDDTPDAKDRSISLVNSRHEKTDSDF